MQRKYKNSKYIYRERVAEAQVWSSKWIYPIITHYDLRYLQVKLNSNITVRESPLSMFELNALVGIFYYIKVLLQMSENKRHMFISLVLQDCILKWSDAEKDLESCQTVKQDFSKLYRKIGIRIWGKGEPSMLHQLLLEYLVCMHTKVIENLMWKLLIPNLKSLMCMSLLLNHERSYIGKSKEATWSKIEVICAMKVLYESKSRGPVSQKLYIFIITVTTVDMLKKVLAVLYLYNTANSASY